jgi:hypothetical protein
MLGCWKSCENWGNFYYCVMTMVNVNGNHPKDSQLATQGWVKYKYECTEMKNWIELAKPLKSTMILYGSTTSILSFNNGASIGKGYGIIGTQSHVSSETGAHLCSCISTLKVCGVRGKWSKVGEDTNGISTYLVLRNNL